MGREARKGKEQTETRRDAQKRQAGGQIHGETIMREGHRETKKDAHREKEKQDAFERLQRRQAWTLSHL